MQMKHLYNSRLVSWSDYNIRLHIMSSGLLLSFTYIQQLIEISLKCHFLQDYSHEIFMTE